MKHVDEEVVDMINRKEKEKEFKRKEGEIQERVRGGTIIIDGEAVEFEEKNLLDNKVKICLPKNFEFMSHEDAIIKYPSERRPKIIFTNETTSVNIAFNYTENLIKEDLVEEFKDNVIETVKKMQPAITWLENGVEKINEKNVGFYEMLAPNLDCETYNLIFFCELHGRALLCNFNCLEDEMESWRMVARAVMRTIKIL